MATNIFCEPFALNFRDTYWYIGKVWPYLVLFYLSDAFGISMKLDDAVCVDLVGNQSEPRKCLYCALYNLSPLSAN